MALTHGLRSTYVTGGCRCDGCRNANRVYQQALVARRKAGGVPGHVPHGRPSTYTNWSCRCVECRAAWRVEMRRQYVARKAAARDEATS